jgi:transcriptional regulator with XRE-family HTH domain
MHARLLFQGATLKTLRQRRKLTLRALAKRLGVTYQAVHNWEKGTNDPSAELLPIIAQELGCEIGDLYLEYGSATPSNDANPCGGSGFSARTVCRPPSRRGSTSIG